MKKPVPAPTRRQFLKTTTGAAAGATAMAMNASSYARVIGANERISVAQIGCGNRGFGAHMPGIGKHATDQNIEITAVCDVWTEYRERAVEKVKEDYGRAPRAFTAYKEVLVLDDVDAVMIATCDFQHARMLEDTANAKKDCYCEKPLSMDVEALRSSVDAVKKNGVVCQMGTQRRSYPTFRGCRETYRSGILGDVSRIEIFSNGSKPNWYKRLVRKPLAASEVDWPQFLMHLPERPFSDQQFAGWFGYRDYCSGSIGQFMSHYSDLINFLTGTTYPESAVAAGGTFVWDDEHKFDCRDQVQVTLTYPEGFMFTYLTNFGNAAGRRTMIYGNNGIMDINDKKPFLSGEGAFEKGKIPLEPEAIAPVECPDHFLDWLQCLRTRGQPVAPIEAGHEHSIACIMADRAMQTGQRQIYDRAKDQIRPG